MGPLQRIAVFISGSGTNLQALIDYFHSTTTKKYPHSEIVLVVSSRSNAYGLTRASNAEPPIPTHVSSLYTYLKRHGDQGKTRTDWEVELAETVKGCKPDIIVLAGFMLILGEAFLDRMVRDWEPTSAGEPRRPVPIINLHPSLPPSYGNLSIVGANAIERGWKAFNGIPDPEASTTEPSPRPDKTGVTVHHCTAILDGGEPVVVREIPFVEGEPLEKLEERIHKVEWEAIVQATEKLLQEQRAKVEGS